MTITFKRIAIVAILVAIIAIGAISWARYVSFDRREGARLNLAAYEAVGAGQEDDSIKKVDAALKHRLTRRNRAIAYYNRGIASNRKWKFDEAIRDHTTALSLDPKYVHAYGGRSFAYYHRGELTQAIEDLDVAVRLDPNSYDAHFNRATMFFHKRQFDRALNDLEEAIRCDPNSAQPFLLRGICYEAMDDLDHALANFDAAIFMNSENAMAYMQRSLLYHRKGEREKALNDHIRADQLDPEAWKKSTDLLGPLASAGPESPVAANWSKYGSTGPAVAFQNALAASNMGDHDGAIALYNLVLQSEITSDAASTASMNRGNAYRAKGDAERALHDYDQAIRLNPKNAGAYVNRGLALSDKGKMEEALKDYETAITLNPDQWEAYFDRANLFARQGHPMHAIDDLNIVARLNPNYVITYVDRAAAYLRVREWNQAIEDCNTAIKSNSSIAQAYAHRAIAQEGLGHLSEAWADLQKSASLDAKKCFQQLNEFAWRRATSPEGRNRNGKEAVEAATKACGATDWKESGTIDTLAAAYAENGDFDQAIKFQGWVLDLIGPTDNYYAETKKRLKLYEQHKPYREESRK